MKKYTLKNFTKGWFIGNFKPSLKKTEDFEIAIKEYKKGDKDEVHYHKVAQEYTVIVSGEFCINDKIYKKGDIIQFEPMDVSHFFCKDDGITVVVKMPSVKNDKYIISNE